MRLRGLPGRVGRMTRPAYLQVSVAEDGRFELPRLASNTLSNNADQRSPGSATVRELRKHDLGEHR